MARLARIVLPNTPHHITQRGNRRQRVFFRDDDYAAYIQLVAEYAAESNTQVLAYCLMPNHVHFVMLPSHTDGLRATLGEAHRRYTRRINQRKDWKGHLWQERFYSFPMDEPYLYATLRYVELNPVRAKLVKEPDAWPWSSARAHLAGRSDRLVKASAQYKLVADWDAFLAEGMAKSEAKSIEKHLRTGRPCGGDRFIAKAENALGRKLGKDKPGPKPRLKQSAEN